MSEYKFIRLPWEIVDDGHERVGGFVLRAKIHGGWLLRCGSFKGGDPCIDSHHFVPDPEYQWEL